MGKTQYVIKNGSGWAVRGEGNSKLTKVVQTQKEAIGIARSIAKNQKAEMRVQDNNGRFRTCNSYGSDPCPPRDKNR